ncbi:MAG: SMC-Scp complex subunit ScpB, partial [Deltaproteobacteria bacterium]|nr:SMC-Scp complex subunit ScpB [Deltaproteobacteria bacterium]
MDEQQLPRVLEAVLFASPEPLAPARLLAVVEHDGV